MLKQFLNLSSQVAKKRSISTIQNGMNSFKSISTRNTTQFSIKQQKSSNNNMLDSSIIMSNFNKRNYSASTQEAVTFVGTNDNPQQPVDVQAEVASDEDFFFATRQMTPREGFLETKIFYLLLFFLN